MLHSGIFVVLACCAGDIPPFHRHFFLLFAVANDTKDGWKVAMSSARKLIAQKETALGGLQELPVGPLRLEAKLHNLSADPEALPISKSIQVVFMPSIIVVRPGQKSILSCVCVFCYVCFMCVATLGSCVYVDLTGAPSVYVSALCSFL